MPNGLGGIIELHLCVFGGLAVLHGGVIGLEPKLAATATPAAASMMPPTATPRIRFIAIVRHSPDGCPAPCP
jgi:hypothetical protein